MTIPSAEAAAGDGFLPPKFQGGQDAKTGRKRPEISSRKGSDDATGNEFGALNACLTGPGLGLVGTCRRKGSVRTLFALRETRPDPPA
jgi:hypothetical protein